MRLSVEKYKSIFKKMSIDVKGMTIIAGANSSGKSSFMQPFMILKQTIENNTDGNSLIINGENANLTEAKQLLCGGKKEGSFCVFLESINNDLHLKEESRIEYEYDTKEGFTAINSSLSSSSNSIFLKKNMSVTEISGVVSDLKKRDKFFRNLFNKIQKDNKLVSRINNSKSFLHLDSIPSDMFEKKQHVFSFGFTPTGVLEDFVEKIIHIPGIRSNPKRMYGFERYNETFQGRFDKYTAPIIYDWCSKKSPQLEELISLIRTLGLATNIYAEKINEAYINLSISRYYGAEEDDLVDLSDVGFGLSQVLPILIAVIEAKPDNTIYIEQPEIHLHPLAQYKLAQILCNYVANGKKLIIETHSSIFIRALQTEIAMDSLDFNTVSLNWFTQDKNGETSVFEAQLDELGSFGEWPSDFDDIYLNAEGAFLDAVEKRFIQ